MGKKDAIQIEMAFNIEIPSISEVEFWLFIEATNELSSLPSWLMAVMGT